MQNSNLDGVLSNVNNFNFDAEHNGITCIASLDPKNKGTSHQFWFTRQMLADLFEVSDNTITRHIESLVEWEEIAVVQNCTTVKITNSTGAMNETTLYDLHVFNKLAMDLRTPKARELKSRFSDILVKHETGTIVEMPNFEDPADAAEAWAKMYREKRAVQKALDAEKEQHKKDNEDFCEYVDILNQKKAEISTRREATAMNTASQKSKECKRLTVENTKLTTENEELKDEVGRGTNWKQVTAIEWYDEFFIKSRDANFYSQCGRILTQISKEMGIEVGKVQDTKYTKNSYYISVVDEFRNRLENGVTFSRIKQYYRHNYNLTLF